MTAFGLYSPGTATGLALGPAVGGLLADESLGSLFLIDAVTSSVWRALGLAALPDTPGSSPAAQRSRVLRRLASDHALLRFLTAAAKRAMWIQK